MCIPSPSGAPKLNISFPGRRRLVSTCCEQCPVSQPRCKENSPAEALSGQALGVRDTAFRSEGQWDKETLTSLGPMDDRFPQSLHLVGWIPCCELGLEAEQLGRKGGT